MKTGKTDYEDWATNQSKAEVVADLVELNKSLKGHADELLRLRADQKRIKDEFARIYEELKKASDEIEDSGKLLAEFYINLHDLKI